ncbi:hypothetical protein F3523_08850 [Campylobacter upsaliensis]|nr:hypothetical protein [Campylobacter upsaliensis]EAJ5079803.1 hypothetical protein [Campylobacter upsaliensis]ECW8267789.1 hypothetical protein [Campylobacter upsaliensis]ECW8268429.1 hypothetical protein [Campylobacter upsaliensis]EHJ5442557.1 hypothetical protein [Campylobacter upsaliensis]
MLHAKIKNFSYIKYWEQDLERYNFNNINDLPSKCIVNFENKSFAISKWVSPKRTRSYPYARVYDTFSSGTNKVVTIIPLIKDEGINGDRDYLQWDSLSLMSLLNVYVIIAFYDRADLHPTKQGKITNQQFNNEYICKQLSELANYHQSALHWNINQLENLPSLAKHTKNAYVDISTSLGVKLHNTESIDNFIAKIIKSKEAFMDFSRTKARAAQQREVLTLQPKEQIGIGQKCKITIENYLGGQYFFTCDDVLLQNNILVLCESKHSKNALLPSNDDIKDGLLKLMLYNNIDSIVGYEKFKVVLRLTSTLLKDSCILPSNNLQDFIKRNSFSKAHITMLEALNRESSNNHFEVWINL